MSFLSNPFVASAVARGMQSLQSVAQILGQAGAPKGLFPEHAGKVRRMTIPTAVTPAPVVVYAPESQDPRPPVHVNFYGCGYILRDLQGDDAVEKARDTYSHIARIVKRAVPAKQSQR